MMQRANNLDLGLAFATGFLLGILICVMTFGTEMFM